MLKRSVLSSGIPSLDKIIDGGFGEGDVILVAGQPGAEKSALAMQSIYNGVLQYDQARVYATFVESATKLGRDMLRFGLDLLDLEKKGKVTVLDLAQSASNRGEANPAELIGSISKVSAERLVVDSLSAVMTYIETRSQATIEMGFEGFLADRLIALESSLENPKVRRRNYIPKMHGVDHSLDCYDFNITPKALAYQVYLSGNTGGNSFEERTKQLRGPLAQLDW